MDRDKKTFSGHGLRILYANGTGLELADWDGRNKEDRLI